MATVQTRTNKSIDDSWEDKIERDARNPLKVLVFLGSLVGFVWFVIRFVIG
jgi:hypothetical protein